MSNSIATIQNPVDHAQTAPPTATEWSSLLDVPAHVCVRDRIGTKWAFDDVHGWRFTRDGVVYSPKYLSPDFWTWLGPFTAVT